MRQQNKRGRLFVLSGPSGAGKGTVRKRLFESMPDLIFSISCTTRDPRPGEVDGADYRFISEGYFKSLVDQGLFLEWAHVHDHRYGTLKSDVDKELSQGRDVVLEIDVQGALQVRSACPECVLIFIMPPSIAELERRLKKRGTEEDSAVELRLHNAVEEMKMSEKYDYVVVNDEVERAVMEIREIILNYRINR
ncbi:MAG TPA: guanylate kinase [Aminobacterium sp.]|mgnify:CR=1 FL=1|jgi:guanylate kinase|uniref:guanylate kinase n=1 Tax=Aminobacterium TaxID=81466 RepID=UPI000465F817|nr:MULTISPECIES: guanylate kinase [Aminobacterium]HCA40187.1 guanylate kinase [Aminobacterium sp.]